MTTEPTAGAVKAAEQIANYEEEHYGKIAISYPGPNKEAERQAIAAIIDRETGLPEKNAALRGIAALHGNMSLDSIEQVNGINDGRDRAIKLRVAIETARDALAKYEGKE